MSIQHIKKVRIAGISAAVPQHVSETIDSPVFPNKEECERYMENVGVERVRRHPNGVVCSDLCLRAAEELVEALGWERNEIDLLVYVSQSQDYVLPATACVLHGKLGLAQSCSCFDVSLGCSGWAYGLSIVAGMMQSGAFRKALLLAGDASPLSFKHPSSRSSKPLFGDAGTATCLVYDEQAAEMVIDNRTDGTGYEAIIKRGGACRHPFDKHSLERVEDQFGNVHRIIDTEMDGAAVFTFGITKVPRAIKDMLRLTERTVEDVDYFLFHQANLMMNEQIRKKCKIPVEKCPYSIRDFGNNSSASIPLTMVTELRETLSEGTHEIVACGFGVGLSWSTLYTTLQAPVVLPLIEIS